MGFVLIAELLGDFRFEIELLESAHAVYQNLLSINVDYRLVQVMRDLHSAIVSGYLYHLDGRECWKDPLGRPKRFPNGRPIKRLLSKWTQEETWERHLSYELKPPADGRNLCQYLAGVPEPTGVRAYLDYVMNTKYNSILGIWALSQEFAYVRERTSTVCFEKLSSNDEILVRDEIERVINFLFNGTSHNFDHWQHHKRKAFARAHQTSHDPVLRQRLVETIRGLDQEHYNGDIAWLRSVIPCQTDSQV